MRGVPQQIQHRADEAIVCRQGEDKFIRDIEDGTVVHFADGVPGCKDVIGVEPFFHCPQLSEGRHTFHFGCAGECALKDKGVGDNQHRHPISLFACFLVENSPHVFGEAGARLGSGGEERGGFVHTVL